MTGAEVAVPGLLAFVERTLEARDDSRVRLVQVAISAPGKLAYSMRRMSQQLIENAGRFSVPFPVSRERALAQFSLDGLPEM